MTPPALSNYVVLAEDPWLTAKLCCALSKPNMYLPVIEAARIGSPHAEFELVRRNNIITRHLPREVFFAGYSDQSYDAQMGRWNPVLRRITKRVSDTRDFPSKSAREPIVWGRQNLGIGLLRALRAGSDIVFSAGVSPQEAVASKSGHLVVCEQGELLSEVIAANYAYALKAGLLLIPKIEQGVKDRILEDLYGLYDQQELSQSDAQQALRRDMLALMPALEIPTGGSITFISSGLPLGFAVPNVPSTHLFSYPELGHTVLNGLAAEQADQPGIGFVTLVNPETTPAEEIATATKIFFQRGALVRVYEGANANVRDVTRMLELLPYDLLIIATHCGDSGGYRWTYEFQDREGHHRTLVVDIAIGVGRTDDANMLAVTQFMRFVSLDGVDWNDPDKDKKVHVGTAILDFIEFTRPSGNELKPIKKENIERVVGSSALKLSDDNLLIVPKVIADQGSPVIINNACLSWHRLAGDLLFSGARAYVSTLFPVTTSEANDVIVRLLEKHADKPLAAAVWSAQRTAYGNEPRRPYVVAGVYPQSLRVRRHDVPHRIANRLAKSVIRWEKILSAAKHHERRTWIAETVSYLKAELAHFKSRR